MGLHGKFEKVTVSLSEELCRAVNVLCGQFGLSRSRLIEMCLREHASVDAAVRRSQGQAQATVVQVSC
jgi:metal-responsive CopG/Arc/MetJ family transcriptional regulator